MRALRNHLGVGVALGLLGAAPLVAPKPAVREARAVCAACGRVAATPPSGAIRRTQAGPELASPRTTEPRLLPELASPSPNAGLNELLDRFLPDATPEERRVWAEELRTLPPQLARDILSARSKGESAGSTVPPLPEPPLSENLPPLPPLPPDEPAATFLPPRIEPAPSAVEATVAAPAPAESFATTVELLRRVERVHLHNIANAETVGFKRLCPDLCDAAALNGVCHLRIRRVATPGPLARTENALDLAIRGRGYFQVARDGRSLLTRRGTFALDDEQNCVLTIAGEAWTLSPGLTIPAEAVSVHVSAAGVVLCRLSGSSERVPIGQIELAQPFDESAWESVGGGLIAAASAEPAVAVGVPGAEAFGTIEQGGVESSNVRLEEELAALERLRRRIRALESSAPAANVTPIPQPVTPPVALRDVRARF